MGPADIIVIITTSKGDAQGYLWKSADYGEQGKAIEWAVYKFHEEEDQAIKNSQDAMLGDTGYVRACIVSIQVADLCERADR